MAQVQSRQSGSRAYRNRKPARMPSARMRSARIPGGAEFAKQTNGMAREAVRLSEHMAEAIEINTGVLQDVWRSGLNFAGEATRQSLGQFTSILEKAPLEKAAHFAAPLKSADKSAEAPRPTSRLPNDWFELVNDVANQQLLWLQQIGKARTPQDLMVLYTEMLRFNLLRLAQITQQAAEQVSRTSERFARPGSV